LYVKNDPDSRYLEELLSLCLAFKRKKNNLLVLILLNLPRFISLLLMRIMKNRTTKYLSLLILLTTASISIAQEKHHYQTDFQTGEFAERRE